VGQAMRRGSGFSGRLGRRGGWVAGAVLAGALGTAAPGAAVTLDWVVVDDPGNAADDTGFGAVGEVFRISATEITNAQYVEFLNAVAAADPNGLFNPEMASSPRGGITRSGTSGSFTYSSVSGREDEPVSFVSFWDALRFANWLHNGEPTGAQEDSTTEDGAYTLTPQGISDNSVERNPGATVFLTSEDEWYKAAYYDPASDTWFDFPAGTDAQIACGAPGAAPNTANCDDAVGDPTEVGSYTGSASPNGTFDQGGNVWEWNEAIVAVPGGSQRGVRGGSFNAAPGSLAAGVRSLQPPGDELDLVGFRVSTVPEPGARLGLLAALGALGLLGWRRRRA